MICADVDVVSLNDYLERVDVVVVTAITFFDDIKEKLSKKFRLSDYFFGRYFV